jgi:hypothetical protein
MRVLEEARNRHHPLLERLRFLSISGNNLDEFFMVRVALLVGQVRAMVEISPDGLNPEEQLENPEICPGTDGRTDRRWLKSELTENGITIVSEEHLTGEEHKWLDNRFLEHILPIVIPIAIDPAHSFPSFSIAVSSSHWLKMSARRRYHECAASHTPQLERLSGCREPLEIHLIGKYVAGFPAETVPGLRCPGARACSASSGTAISNRGRGGRPGARVRERPTAAAAVRLSAWK